MSESIRIDMQNAKYVMKGMSQDQQNLVEQLLTKLRQEQIHRLQSEEQNEQVISRMILTQQQLEQQIRNITAKGKPARDIQTTMNGANSLINGTTAGGLSSNAITPIGSFNGDTMNHGKGPDASLGQSDTFADFVRDNSAA